MYMSTGLSKTETADANGEVGVLAPWANPRLMDPHQGGDSA